MAQLVIPDLDERSLEQLQQRASDHGRPPEVEARLILTEALKPARRDPWAVVDAIREELAATGRDFGDSTKLIREDRAR